MKHSKKTLKRLDPTCDGPSPPDNQPQKIAICMEIPEKACPNAGDEESSE